MTDAWDHKRASYSVFGPMRLAWELLLTRLLNPSARLIRRPIHVRGQRNISFGRSITIGRGARIEAYGVPGETNIAFGGDVQINDYVHIGAARSVTIGNRVLIASRVFITDHNHGSYAEAEGEPASAPFVPPAARPCSVAPVVIEDDVWLGEGVCVLPGVTIGAGTVVGAGAVVTRDLPAGCVAVGNPAHVVRRYHSQRGWTLEGAA